MCIAKIPAIFVMWKYRYCRKEDIKGFYRKSNALNQIANYPDSTDKMIAIYS